MIQPHKMYIGIVEDCDWEGETFGYYWELNDESRAALQQIGEAYADDDSKRVEEIAGSELIVLDKHDKNGYMSRVNVYRAPDNWDAWIAEQFVDPESDDPFYKGLGLAELKY